MGRRYTYATTLSFGTDGEPDYTEVGVEVSYTVSWGAPERPPIYSHGGLPADPDEIDDICLEKVEGKPRPWDMGYGFLSDDQFAEMVADQLDTDHYAAMLEEAADTELADHDDALERRWEERRELDL